MSLTHDEINAFTSKYIQFDSRHGSISFYGMRHPELHMNGVSHHIMVSADNVAQEITFKNGSNTFRNLTARAYHSINVETDLNTTDGHLELIFHYGNLDLSEDVDIISQGKVETFYHDMVFLFPLQERKMHFFFFKMKYQS